MPKLKTAVSYTPKVSINKLPDLDLNDIQDVDATPVSPFNVLYHDGSQWVVSNAISHRADGLGVFDTIGNDPLVLFHDDAETRLARFQSLNGLFYLWNEVDSEEVQLRVNDSASSTKIPLRVGTSGTSTAVGFQGTAPITKPDITGSTGANAALQNLLTALENYGLITDSTT